MLFTPNTDNATCGGEASNEVDGRGGGHQNKRFVYFSSQAAFFVQKTKNTLRLKKKTQENALFGTYRIFLQMEKMLNTDKLSENSVTRHSSESGKAVPLSYTVQLIHWRIMPLIFYRVGKGTADLCRTTHHVGNSTADLYHNSASRTNKEAPSCTIPKSDGGK